MNSIDENTLDTIKWLYLVNLIFYISTTISRIFVVRDVSIEFEKTRLDCTKKNPPEIKEYIYLTLKNVVKRRDILYHHIVIANTVLEIFKTKNLIPVSSLRRERSFIGTN